MKLLLIEDQDELLQAMRFNLETAGFYCASAMRYRDALLKVEDYTYDVVIVDIHLPDGSGLDIIRFLKKTAPATGIIIVSALDSVNQRIEGMQLGADDYITKPFDMAEMVVRVKALLRRRVHHGEEVLKRGLLRLFPMKREVWAGESKVDMTRSEFDILLFLMSNPRRVVSRESLAEHIWGDHMDVADSFDFIYSHIKNLRKKLQKAGVGDVIQTVYGVGYKLGGA